MAVGGFPVVLSDRGAPFVAVEKGAPLATVAENGRGLPIRVVDKGAPPLTIQGYNVWSPADLFENGEFGSWYDTSALDMLFQDANGTTPAVPGSPVGLVLDARKEMGPERVTNGTFDTDLSGWDGIGNVSATWVDGEVQITGVGAVNAHNNNWLSQVVLEPDDSKLWQVRFDATWVSGGNLQVGTGFNIRATVTPNTGKTTYTLITPRGTTSAEVYHDRLTFGGPVGAVWRLDNISVREVLNPPLSQPTTAARPILARMPKTGRQNLLTWTEDFSNAVWKKNNSPIIGETVDGLTLICPTTTNNYNSVYQAATVPAGSVGIVKGVFKAGGYKFVQVLSGAGWGINTWVNFDLENGTIGNKGTKASGTIRPLGDGTYECIAYFSEAATNTSTFAQFVPLSSDTNERAPNVIGDGVSGVYIGRTQLTVGAEDAPYQHVRSAYDVTEEGVPDTYSLVYDLADDNLTTTLPQAINGDILIAGRNGSIIEPFSGNTLTIGPRSIVPNVSPTYAMEILGDIVGVCLIDRELSQAEKDQLIRYYKGKGAKGLFVPGGPELITDIAALVEDPETVFVNCTAEVMDGEVILTATATGVTYFYPPYIPGGMDVSPGIMGCEISSPSGSPAFLGNRSGGEYTQAVRTEAFQYRSVVRPSYPTGARLQFRLDANEIGQKAYFKNISFRELRPQEDWT